MSSLGRGHDAALAIKSVGAAAFVLFFPGDRKIAARGRVAGNADVSGGDEQGLAAFEDVHDLFAQRHLDAHVCRVVRTVGNGVIIAAPAHFGFGGTTGQESQRADSGGQSEIWEKTRLHTWDF